MNKKDASEYLGVSERAIERYAKKGKLHPARLEVGGGKFMNDYDERELAHIKHEMQEPKQTTALATRQPDESRVALPRRPTPGDYVAIVNAASVKPSVSMIEATLLSGCSEAHIMRGVEKGKIKHDYNGPRGSLRLKREDVLKWADTF